MSSRVLSQEANKIHCSNLSRILKGKNLYVDNDIHFFSKQVLIVSGDTTALCYSSTDTKRYVAITYLNTSIKLTKYKYGYQMKMFAR